MPLLQTRPPTAFGKKLLRAELGIVQRHDPADIEEQEGHRFFRRPIWDGSEPALAAAVAATLTAVRPIGLYGVILIRVSVDVVRKAEGSPGHPSGIPEILELVLLGLAAVFLPALVTFTVYLCLIQACGTWPISGAHFIRPTSVQLYGSRP